MATARGTFEVRIDAAVHDQAGIDRRTITKTWSGDIRAAGVGTMLGAGDPASGTAGYVALETVDGSLSGRRGRFALQQFGTMSAGTQHLQYQVVPGSGTGELVGLSGVLDLEIVAGEHRYVLTYSVD